MVDTNLLVAAALHPQRLPAQLFSLIIEETVINHTSEAILEEVSRVLRRHGAELVLQRYIQHSVIVYPVERIHICRDPTDDKFIECALAANADLIISGDRALLEVEEFRGIRILTVSEFLER